MNSPFGLRACTVNNRNGDTVRLVFDPLLPSPYSGEVLRHMNTVVRSHSRNLSHTEHVSITRPTVPIRHTIVAGSCSYGRLLRLTSLTSQMPLAPSLFVSLQLVWEYYRGRRTRTGNLVALAGRSPLDTRKIRTRLRHAPRRPKHEAQS